MRKLLQLKLLVLALLGVFELGAQCSPASLPYSENFNTWPPSCWDLTVGTSAVIQYSGGSANFDFWNVSSGTMVMRSDTIIISADARVKFKWSSNSSTFYEDELTLRVRSVSSTTWDTLWYKKGSDLASNDGATNTAPGSFVSEIFNLSSAYTGDSVEFEFYGVSDFGPNAFVDDFLVEVQPACPEPLGLFANNLMPTGATARWSSVSAASSYSIIYGVTGFDPATAGSSTTSTTDSVVLSGLTAATDYDFYVISDCGASGTSDTSAVGMFTTSCAAMALPYSQDFDGTSAGGFGNPSLPNCWEYYSSANGYMYTSGFGANSVPNALYIYNSTFTPGTDTLIAASPEFIGLDSANKQITFWARDGSTFSQEGVVFGTMGDPLDPSTFHPLDTIDLGDSYAEYIYYLDSASGYNGTDDHVAFAHAQKTTFSSIYIDDIVINDIPACPKPVVIAASNISSSSVILSWQSSGIAFNIEYGPVGFTQGTGLTSNPTQNSDTLTGLSPNTCYDVYIQNNCAPLNGLSVWSGPFNFCTLCSAKSTPITENFDATAIGSFTNPSAPDCWMYTETSSHPGYGYTYFSTFNLPNSVPNQFYLYNSNASPSDVQLLVSPEVATITTQNVQAKFYGRGNGATVVVGTMSDPFSANSFTAIDTVTLTNTYAMYTVQLGTVDGYNGTDGYVAFAHGNSGIFQSVYLDDITIEDIPSCYPSANMGVTGLTAMGATITWNPGDGISHDMEYGPAGFSQSTGTFIYGITDSSQALTGLTPNTCYDVYLRDSCTAGTYSPWAGPFSFCTPCVAQTMPYTQDFDTWPLTCWIVDDGSQPWDEFVGLGNSHARANFWSFGSGNTFIMKSPPVAVTQKAQVKFEWSRGFSTFYQDRLIVIATSSGSSIPDTLFDMQGSTFSAPGATNTAPGTFLPELFYLDSAKYVGNEVTVEFVGISAFGPSAFVDDFVVEAQPTCPDPINLTATNIQGYQAIASWTAISGSQFFVEYGLQGFSQGTGGGTLDTTSSSSLLITGLIPVTCYDYYVMADCGGSGTSSWAGPFNFCTTVSCPAPSNTQLNTVTTTDAWLSWTSGGASNWDYIIGPNPTTPSTGTVMTAASDSINVTGLAPATTYDFWVRDSCGPGDVSVWTGPFTFSTLCNTFSLNYLENFQGWVSGNALACWDELIYNSMPVDRYTSGSDVMAEFRYWSYIAPNDVAFTSPAISITAKSRLRFKWSHLYSASYPLDQVIVMAKTTGSSSWDTLADYIGTSFTVTGAGNTSPAPSMQEDTIALDSNYIGNDIQVRFLGISGFGPNYYLNDVVVEVDPAFTTCPNPTNLAASNITTTSADIGWTAGGTGSSWQLSYGIGTTAATGTKIVTTTNPHALSALSPSSTYSVYIREICSAGDTSVWLGPVSFNTPCVAATLPYSLGFNSWPPVCVNLTGGSFNWDHYSGTAARANFWSTSSGEAWMTTNEIGVNSPAQLRYEWSRGSSTFYNDSLYILSRVVGTTAWDTIKVAGGSSLESNDGASNTTPGSYVSDTIPLPTSYVGDTIEVAFVGVTDFGPSLFIKSAMVELLMVSSCPAPSNVMATFGCDSATISWTSDTASLFTIVRWDTAGFNPIDTSQGTTIILATSPLQLTGLMPGTSYDVWIVDSCVSGTSATMINFTTASGPKPSIAYTAIQGNTTLTTADVAFDASATTDGVTYTWDFGGGNTASGPTANYTYSANGTNSVTLTVTNGCGVSDTTFNVDVQGIGIEESLLSRSLKVYPNPTAGQFRVTFQISGIQEIEVRVLNTAGQIVQSENVGNISGTFNAKYDLSNEAKGIYILQIKTAQGVISKRISVQ